MKAIILAGGFATRLRPLTLTKPKPALPILNKPLILWLIEAVKRAGISEVIICVRYMADHIERIVDNVGGVSIKLVRERKPLGDAGPLSLVHREVGLDETFVVLYGDVFSDVDLRSVIEYHRAAGGLATLTLVEVDDPSRYGIAELVDGRIVRFIEKPKKDEVFSNLANAGIYVFEPEVLNFIPSDRPSKLARDIIPKLVETQQVYGYIHRGIWIDIGVPRDYLRANIEALRKLYPHGYVDPSADIGSDVEIEQPVYIGRNVVIGKNCFIGPHAVIGDNTSLGEGVRVLDSVLFNDVQVDRYSYIEGSILGSACVVGRWCRIEAGCVLGDEVVLSDSVFLARRTYVLPYKEVETSIYEEGRVIL